MLLVFQRGGFCFVLKTREIYEMYHVISGLIYAISVRDFTEATLSTVSEKETSKVTELGENASAAEPVPEDSDLPGISESAEKNELNKDATAKEDVSLNEQELGNVEQNISEKEKKQVLPSQKDENDTEDVKELESFCSETTSNMNASGIVVEHESKSSAHAEYIMKDEVQMDINEPEILSTLENQAVNKCMAKATTGAEMDANNQIPNQLETETNTTLTSGTLELDHKIKNKDEDQSDKNKFEIVPALENRDISESTTQALTEDEIERRHQIPDQAEKTRENDTNTILKSGRLDQDNKVDSSRNLLPQVSDKELPPISPGNVRTPQLYLELDSIAKTSGKA